MNKAPISYASQTFTKVAPYLFKTEAGQYYGRKKYKNKTHKRSLDTDDFEKAKRELKAFLKEIESEDVERPDVLFDVAADNWLASLYNLKTKTKGRHETCVKNFKRTFKGKQVRAITKHDLNEWAKVRAKQIAPRTFNIERESLVMLFDYAVKTLGALQKNLAKELPKMKAKKKAVIPPTREQFAELVAFLDLSKRLKKKLGQNSAVFVRFLAYSGMRIDEARHVLWKHVNFDLKKGSLLITGGSEGTKNMNQRTIPLFPALRDLLEKFPKEDRKANSPIFEILTAKKLLGTASKAMGLEKEDYFTHHDMRHFFCSNAIELLIPDHVIAAWLGHKDGGILVKTTYGHLRKSFSDAEALKMTFAS